MNYHIKKILVPVDGSKQSARSIKLASNLAHIANAEMMILNVIPHIADGGARTKAFDKQLLEISSNILKQAKKVPDRQGIKVKTRTIKGSPGPEIVKAVKNGKYDHIVMSTTGTGMGKEGMLGSVSNFVLHKSKIPVYLSR